MPFYITAHYADGSQKFGNLDGQAVIRTRRPLLSPEWKRLGIPLQASHRVFEWHLVDEVNNILAVKKNPRYQEPN